MKTLTVKFALDEDSWTLDFHKITVDEAIELRHRTGVKYAQLVMDLEEGDALALKAFLWLARVKAGEKVDYDDVTFTMMSLSWRVITSEPEESPDPTTPAKSKTSRTR